MRFIRKQYYFEGRRNVCGNIIIIAVYCSLRLKLSLRESHFEAAGKNGLEAIATEFVVPLPRFKGSTSRFERVKVAPV